MRKRLIQLLRAYDLDRDDEHFISQLELILAQSMSSENSITMAVERPSESNEAEGSTLSLNDRNDDGLQNSSEPLLDYFNIYRFRSQIGQGGMGEVWRVHDPLLDRTVALKMINEKYRGNQEKLLSFSNEARIGSQLQHPGIVPIYAYHQSASQLPAFTMREIEGRMLSEVIKAVHQSGKEKWGTTSDGWSLRRLVRAFHSVCETIAYAHSRGVVHCDLKPSNIMIGSFGEVLVVDWGIAKVLRDAPDLLNTTHLSNSSEEGVIIGTPAYMSPEQASGSPELVGFASDIYSLGMVLYVILIGKHPFGGTVEETLRNKRSNQALSFRSPRALPKELSAICQKAMQYEQADRYSSANELANAVQRWLEGAQRREKALEVLGQIKILDIERRDLIDRSHDMWMKANEDIEGDSEKSAAGWSKWTESKKLEQQSETLRQEIFQLLHGAIIYDSGLTELHRRLVALEYSDFLDANVRMDAYASEKSYRRMEIYLEYLPADEEMNWRTKIQRDLTLRKLLRKRHGRFIGRWSQQKEIESGFHSHSTVSLVGTAGVGKTHLALQAAANWGRRLNGAVLFCDLTTASDELGILQILGRSLDIHLLSNNPWASIIAKLGQKSNVLLVLDNVEQIVSSIADLVTRFTLTLPNLKLLVTSRTKLGLADEYQVQLNPLSLLEGVEMFEQKARLSKSDFKSEASNRRTLLEIVERLDRLPLAIELAAARTSMLSVDNILDRISERFVFLRGRLRDPRQKALQGALEWSWGLLSQNARKALVQCSVFRGGFTVSAAEAVISFPFASDSTGVLDMVEALCDDNLVQREKLENGMIRYSLLVSIRSYARQKTVSILKDDELSTLQNRYAKYYANLYQNSLDRPPVERTRLLLDEISNFTGAISHGQSEDSFFCCLAAVQYFELKGPMASVAEITEEFLVRNDLYDELRRPILLRRIRGLRLSGQVERARMEFESHFSVSKEEELRQGIDVAIGNNDLEGGVNLWCELGELYYETERFSDSQKAYEEALRVCENIGSPIKTGLVEVGLSLIMVCLGRLEEALELLERSESRLPIDTDEYGLFLCEKSRIYKVLQKEDIANDCLERAVQVVQELGTGASKRLRRKVEQMRALLGRTSIPNTIRSATAHYSPEETKRFMLANQLVEKGNIDELQSKYDRAMESFNMALELYTELMYERGMAEVLNVISHVNRLLGQPRESLNNLVRAQSLLGDDSSNLHAEICTGLGKTYSAFGRYDDSLAEHNKTREIYQELGYRGGEGIACGNLAQTYQSMGKYETAIEYYNLAVKFVREVGDRRNEGVFLGNVGLVYENIGAFEKAERSYRKGMHIANQLGNRRGEAIFLGNIANVYKCLGRYLEAKELYHRSIEIAEYVKSPGTIGLFKGNLGDLYFKMEEWEASEHFLRESIDICLKSYKLAAGAFLGTLGLLLGKKGQINEGIEKILEGEEIIQVYPLEYCKLLCKKALLFHLASKNEEAVLVFEEAKKVATNLKTISTSELGRYMLQTGSVLEIGVKLF